MEEEDADIKLNVVNILVQWSGKTSFMNQNFIMLRARSTVCVNIISVSIMELTVVSSQI